MLNTKKNNDNDTYLLFGVIKTKLLLLKLKVHFLGA